MVLNINHIVKYNVIMPELDQTLSALSDPTRRRIVTMLAEQSLSAGQIGTAFDISAPALRRHLRILRRSGLVEDKRDATDNRLRIFKLQLTPLNELQDWLEEVESFWQGQLLAFKQFAELNSDSSDPEQKNAEHDNPERDNPEHKKT